MKRVLIIILSLTIILSMMVGCGKTEVVESNIHNDTKQKQNNLEQIDDEWIKSQREKWYVGKDVSFNWYLNYSWWPHNKEWTEYPVLKEISQITGVVPKVSIPSGDPTEKLNLMIATNELPDMITMDITDRNVDKLIKQGLVYSYDELIDKYCKEFEQEIPEEVYRYTKSDIDDKLYGLPSWFVPNLIPNNALAYNVRKDIYQELGCPDITTLEEFKKVLIDFKNKYPSLEGKNSIPLSLGENYGGKTILERSFGIREFYVDSENNIKHHYKYPQYIEFIKFLNGLYREGLLDQEGYVKKQDQIKEDLSTRVFCTAEGWWGLWDANAALDAKKPDSHFIVTEALNAGDHKFEVGQSKLGWTITLISKKAKNPDALLKFTRYLWSKDGNKLLLYGHEGEDFTIEDNKVIRNDDFEEEWNKDSTAFSEKTGIHTFRFFQYSYWDNVLTGAFKESPDRAKNRKLANTYVAYDSTPFNYKMQPEPTTEEGIILTQINEIEKKEYAKIIMAKSQKEAVEAYNNMLDNMEKVGLSKLENWWSKRYKNNISKFTK